MSDTLQQPIRGAAGAHRPIRLLTFSTLYPSSNRPTHGIFVETRLRQLLASGAVESRVLAPVPWCPSNNPLFGDYASYANVALREKFNGIEVHHPRYFLLPKIGMTLAPFGLAIAAVAAARKLMRTFDFDVIDAHYFYPDGVAAVILGTLLKKPVVITARGSDINLVPRYLLPRQMIRSAAQRSAAVVTVSAALKKTLLALGADASKITVLRNGVDLVFFAPEDRAEARARFGMRRFSLASVGHLVEAKGHDLVIRALRSLDDVDLWIAGSGEKLEVLKNLVASLGLSERVQFLGAMSQEKLRTLYSAADALVLASSREGWPNVLLEAMACGTPVIAAKVGGTSEIVRSAEAGVLLKERSADAIADAAKALRACLPSRKATRRYAEAFSWETTVKGQIDIFSAVTTNRRSARHPADVRT